MDILQAIGNTSMVRLRKVVPPDCADVLVKLEWENPTGSVKDRMAQAVISRAEEDGRLKPGDTVVEYTGGSTGTSLALVCAARGYGIKIVSSDAFSREKLDHMAALGAELTLVPSEGGLTTKKLILDMIEAARRLSQEPHTYWTDQLNNQDSIAGYYSLGEEIWSQTKGEIDAFVHCVGTGAAPQASGETALLLEEIKVGCTRRCSRASTVPIAWPTSSARSGTSCILARPERTRSTRSSTPSGSTPARGHSSTTTCRSTNCRTARSSAS